MRWIPLLILAYLVVLFQTTVGRVLAFTTAGVGTVAPDLIGLLAVFVALYARSWVDAMLAGWALGFAVDLTIAGGTGLPAAVGPMAAAYCLAAGLLVRVREAFFRERALTQALLAWGFCLITHAAWATVQSLLGLGAAAWSAYGQTLLQVLAVACYTALLMPLVHAGLLRCQRWFLAAPVGPGRRKR
jgi:rod shape-determining protein MreD